MKYDFSVIVLCYNPDKQKLKQTLCSIINQRGISYEIIIADDGSKENYSKELTQWFEQQEFSDYKMVMNEKNQGTVQNLLSALEVAEGSYTKNISPGDYLYNTDALKKYYECMEKEQVKVSFGKAAYYSFENGEIALYGKHSPVDYEVYEKKDWNKIWRNYFWFRDYILGACLAFEVEAARKYTRQISQGVKFAEDTAVLCMLAAGEKIGFVNETLMWYEYGTGISTAASAKWGKIILEENRNVYQMIAERDKRIAKAYKYHFEGNSTNRYLEAARKVVLYPPYLGFALKAAKCANEAKLELTKEVDILKKLLEV